MKIAMINASPKLLIRKQDASASYAILQDIRRELRRDHVHDFEDFHIKTGQPAEETVKLMMSCDVWVISFPIYAGAIPAHFLTFMESVEKTVSELKASGRETRDSREIQVYAVGNGGLFEGNEAYPAFRMISLWCAKCGFSWCGGLGVGGGPVHTSQNVSQIALGQRRSYGRRLDDFADAIAKGIPTLNTSCSPDMSRQGYMMRRSRHYRALARENGVVLAETSMKG